MLTVIGGATGTGKSELALDLAETWIARGVDTEIINADAMQLYTGMDIGTAKLPISARRGVVHHQIDVLTVVQEASVAAYQAHARQCIEQVWERGARPILVGGSGLYIESVIHDLRFPGVSPEIRAGLERRLRDEGAGSLLRELANVDPVSAARLQPGNARRIVRALEVFALTGQPFSSMLPETPEPWCDYRMILLERDRDELALALAERTRRMWRLGIVAETEVLIEAGLREGKTASRAIGYSQAIDQRDGVLTEEEAIEQTAQVTVKYAKRQRTWLRRYPSATRIDVTGGVPPLTTALTHLE